VRSDHNGVEMKKTETKDSQERFRTQWSWMRGRQLAGFSLTTAEILYRMPDHPSLLQTYVWQDYDVHPRFPRLRRFLNFWSCNLDGRLHRVTVVHKGLIAPAELRLVDGEFYLH
jgi:uncharacterized protein Usg